MFVSKRFPNVLQNRNSYHRDLDADYDYNLYRKAQREKRRKVQLATMDVFRNTDSEISSPEEVTDSGEESSPDDMDWYDSEREDNDEVTYQPSYRKLNFDYVI